MQDLKGRDFLKLLDFSPEEIRFLLALAARLKAEKKAGWRDGRMHKTHFPGKNIALIFEKNSTRTRCSFEVAASDLSMGSTYLGPTGSQFGSKESIADTARVLSRIYDGIEYRGFGQDIVEELARHADVPVWNGLTNEFHPTQMLADFLTVQEHFGSLAPDGRRLKLCYMGDARYNMGNSYMVACAKLGVEYAACCPAAYFPDASLVEKCRGIAEKTGGGILLTEDIAEGLRDADVVCTDVWVSMGEPEEVWEERIKALSPYQVNMAAMGMARQDSIFLHCLPSFHNTDTEIAKQIEARFGIQEMEVTDEVFESPRSLVFDEAENRMHTIKAVVYATLGGA